MKKISAEIPLRARRSGGPSNAVQRVRAFARALTPRSVRLATSTPIGGGKTDPCRERPARITPSTVRVPGCRAQPEKPTPSYPNRTSQRRVRGRGQRRLWRSRSPTTDRSKEGRSSSADPPRTGAGRGVRERRTGTKNTDDMVSNVSLYSLRKIAITTVSGWSWSNRHEPRRPDLRAAPTSVVFRGNRGTLGSSPGPGRPRRGRPPVSTLPPVTADRRQGRQGARRQS